MTPSTKHAIVVLALVATAAAHGHVTNIVINGISYQGYGSDTFPYMANPPIVAGWTISQPDNGFVSPDAFSGPDIICHKAAVPGRGHIAVVPGDKISLQWSTWPESHHGPVLDYLASCRGDCESVDKTTLAFFKMDGPALISGANPGYWATDVLIKSNFSWIVQVPAVKPGNYVLRHEIIALHSAGGANGAQAYPMCINLAIGGSGTAAPAGVKGTALYRATDPGILFNLYQSPLSYPVPGPALMPGVPVSAPQSSMRVTASASATVPGGGGGGVGGSSMARPTTTPPSGGWWGRKKWTDVAQAV